MNETIKKYILLEVTSLAMKYPESTSNRTLILKVPKYIRSLNCSRFSSCESWLTPCGDSRDSIKIDFVLNKARQLFERLPGLKSNVGLNIPGELAL